MHQYCLTMLEVQRSIKRNRSGGFPLVFYILMICWGLFGVLYPLGELLKAFDEGVEHPFSVLIGGPGVMLILCVGLAYLLFRWWRKLRRENSPKLFTIRYGRCEDKEFTDMEDRCWHTITAKTDDGAYGRVNVSSDTYDKIWKGDQLYVLVNGAKEIKDFWKAEDTYLARDVLPLLSHADQMQENRKREEQEELNERAEFEPEAAKQVVVDPEREAHIRGELTDDDRRRIRFGYIVRGILFAVFLLIGFFIGTDAIKLFLAYSALILIGIVYDSDSGADCAFIGRAFREEKEKLGGSDPEKLEKNVLRRMRGRRLKLAAANLLRMLPCILFSIIGAVLDKDDFSMGCMVAALAFLLLSLRRLVEAFVRKPRNREQDMLGALLGK